MQTIEPSLSASSKLWGIKWSEHIPVPMGEFTFNQSSYQEFNSFKKNPQNFVITSESSNDSFLKEYLNNSKEIFFQNFSDFFSFSIDGKIIGFAICEVMDWSAYYVRYVFIHPKYRRNNLTIQFANVIEKILQNYQLDKIVCEVSPSNIAQVSRLSSIGYICTGNSQSERFGSLLRLTKFLREDPLNVYNTQYTQSYRENKTREEMTSS